jgi:hypothetical protein
MADLDEIWQELRTVFSGRSTLFDSIIPPIVFLGLNNLFGSQVAIYASIVTVGLIGGFRILHRQSFWGVLGGLATTLIAVGLTYWSGRQETYYLPGMVNSVVMILLFVISLLIKHPLAAYTSHLVRRWPLDWYWQPNVRPAYSEVTMLWIIMFSLRLALQYWLFIQGETYSLAWLEIFQGWPYLILILIGSYIYGIWRLQRLGGPSVEEWVNQTPPPWKGQQRGF